MMDILPDEEKNTYVQLLSGSDLNSTTKLWNILDHVVGDLRNLSITAQGIKREGSQNINM